jgi:hypothetical protein
MFAAEAARKPEELPSLSVVVVGIELFPHIYKNGTDRLRRVTSHFANRDDPTTLAERGRVAPDPLQNSSWSCLQL